MADQNNIHEDRAGSKNRDFAYLVFLGGMIGTGAASLACLGAGAQAWEYAYPRGLLIMAAKDFGLAAVFLGLLVILKYAEHQIHSIRQQGPARRASLWIHGALMVFLGVAAILQVGRATFSVDKLTQCVYGQAWHCNMPIDKASPEQRGSIDDALRRVDGFLPNLF